MASSQIGSLRVALSLGTADFEAGANKAAAVARSKGKEIESAFAGAKAAITGLVGAFAVGFLAEQIKKSLDYAGSLAEVSRTLGVTTKDLQTFRYAASQSGVAQDQLEVGLRRLTVSIGKAELGSTAQIKAFNALGISVDQLKGKTTGDIFRMMSDSLSKVTDRAQRAAIEMVLMGRSGSTLDNLLAPGSKRLNELAEAAQQLGIVLSDSQIQNAEVTAHKLEAVKEVLSAQIAGVVADNAGAILSLASALGQLTGEIVHFLGSNPQLALGIVGALLGGRAGGLPGAVIGGAAGALLGGRIAQSSADANPDLKFRTQQMFAARQSYLDAANSGGGGPAMSVAGIQTAGGAPDTLGRLQEWQRQIKLLQQATAQAKAFNAPKPPGVDLPKFLGGKERKPKKAPRDRTEQDEFQFAQEARRADMDILSAKLQLSHDVSEQAQLQLAMLDLEKQSHDAEVDHRVAQARRDLNEGKITRGTYDEIVQQAAILKAKTDEAEKLKAKAILDDRDRALIQQQEAIDSHYLELKQEMLKKQDALATTQAERRKIELEILDLAYQEKKQALQRIIDEEKIGRTLDQQANDPTLVNAQADLAHLDANHALDRAGVLQQTRGPFESYLSGLPTTAAKWQEALQGVAVNGFGALEQAILDTVSGTKKLGAAFADMAKSIIADLLKISIERSIIAPLANALFGGQSQGGFGGLLGGLIGGGGGSALSIPGLGGGDLTSIGALPDFLSGGSDLAGIAASLPGLAGGGSMKILGNFGTDRNLLSLNGVPIARVNYGEQLNVANDRGGGSVAAPVTFNFHNYARMSDGEARRTGMQAAAGFSSEMAAARRKGIT